MAVPIRYRGNAADGPIFELVSPNGLVSKSFTVANNGDVSVGGTVIHVVGDGHTHAAGDVTSGTFADARVAQSNVTQHVGVIDHDALLNYDIGQHRTINDAGSGPNDLLSAQKILTLSGLSVLHYSETLPEASNATTGYQEKHQASFTPNATGQHIIAYQYMAKADTAGGVCSTRVQLDDTSDFSIECVEKYSYGEYELRTGFKRLSLDNTPHTVDIDIKRGGAGGTAYIKEMRVLVLEGA